MTNLKKIFEMNSLENIFTSQINIPEKLRLT